jgi:hypothetical protein
MLAGDWPQKNLHRPKITSSFSTTLKCPNQGVPKPMMSCVNLSVLVFQ